jgi:aflatoxin B1 aldehyde reductase
MSEAKQESAAEIGLVLGTMTFGLSKHAQTSEADATKMLQIFGEAHPSSAKPELDSARMYDNGGTEEALGNILAKPDNKVLRGFGFEVSSKANPFPTHNKVLTAESVKAQLAASLKALRTDQIALFYLHAPDKSTPLEETLGAVQECYKQNKFREFGLSNFCAWEVVHIYHIMKANGWVLPTVYQGMYNAISRGLCCCNARARLR